MFGFLIISFIAGILTVLAPCVLPLLPIIVGGSVLSGEKRRAYTVIGSLIVSVVLFTLLIKVSSVFLNVSPNTWSYLSAFILGYLGLAMLFPTLWEGLPLINNLAISSNKLLGVGFRKKNFFGDIIMGAALGPVFSTCSPTYFVILATVLPSNFILGLTYLFAYSFGLGLALLAISLFGQKLADRLNISADPRGWLKKTIGVIFLVIAALILTGGDKVVEAELLGTGYLDVTRIEQKLLLVTENVRAPENQAFGFLSSLKTVAERPQTFGRYQEITDPAGFLNTDGKPIKIADYIGKKIILIDFLTYSCINCQRTFPYLVSWNEKYKDKGLLIIGIHTPEFAFEKNIDNVAQALKEEGITFPVVLDNTYGTWNAYKNQYWPRKYIIDLNGNIVFDHIGEGNYDETEMKIQELLRTIPGQGKVAMSTTKDTSAADLAGPKSEETYLGYNRIDHNVNQEDIASCVNRECGYLSPKEIPINHFAYGGTWNIHGEYAEGSVNSEISYETLGKKVHIVLGGDDKAVIAVYVDGKKSKEVIIDHSDLYTLVDETKTKERRVTIKVISGKLHAYAFTFG